jgi:hypothetical protein
MASIKRWVAGSCLVALGLWAPGLYAEGAFADTAPVRDAVPSAAKPQDAATPEVDSAVSAAQQEVRDPFAMDVPPEEVPVSAPEPAFQPASTPISVELQGIGFGSRDAYAIIGGEVFFEGDEKSGIKLLEVRRREVDIVVNGEMRTCLLFPGQDLKNARDRAQKKGPANDVSLDQRPGIPRSFSRRE